MLAGHVAQEPRHRLVNVGQKFARALVHQRIIAPRIPVPYVGRHDEARLPHRDQNSRLEPNRRRQGARHRRSHVAGLRTRRAAGAGTGRARTTAPDRETAKEAQVVLTPYRLQ
jgi:hypothetical protein